METWALRWVSASLRKEKKNEWRGGPDSSWRRADQTPAWSSASSFQAADFFKGAGQITETLRSQRELGNWTSHQMWCLTFPYRAAGINALHWNGSRLWDLSSTFWILPSVTQHPGLSGRSWTGWGRGSAQTRHVFPQRTGKTSFLLSWHFHVDTRNTKMEVQSQI